jgi:hypothetical protein
LTIVGAIYLVFSCISPPMAMVPLVLSSNALSRVKAWRDMILEVAPGAEGESG